MHVFIYLFTENTNTRVFQYDKLYLHFMTINI